MFDKFKDLFNFSKTRNLKEAAVFYVFHTASILALTQLLGL